MKYIFNKQIKSLILVCVLSWMGGMIDLHAQTTIYGPSTADINDVDNYSVNINDNMLHYSWFVNGGTKSNIQEQSVTVTWTSAGTNSVTYDAEGNYDAYYGSITVTVSSGPPATPPMPTITINCGNTVLTRTTSVPSGETYYWQSTSNGTDTDPINAQVTAIRNTGTVYYLRSKKGSQWSAARTVSYTVDLPTTYYADFDGDGFGDPNETISVCGSQPLNYVTSAGDNCPDEAGTVNGCHHLTGNLSDENYIYTVQPRIAMQDLSNTNRDNYIEGVTYFDGLGRTKQNIVIRGGGDMEDIITHVGYDIIGRQTNDYLPYADTSTNLGEFETLALSGTETYYDAKFPNEWDPLDVINPYSEKVFDGTPLNRVLEQGAPGKDWLVDETSDTDHTIKFDYRTNTVDEVSRFSVIFPTGNTEEPQLFYEGSYAANELYVNVVKDENWQPNQTNPEDHTVTEYKNKQGNVVLKRAHLGGGFLDTSYVYDEYGNLTFVLSPKGTDLILYQNTYNPSTMTEPVDELIPLDVNNNPITTGSGNISVTVDDVTKKLTVDFNVSFNSPIDLLNGSIAKFQSDIPNMMVGNITSGGVNYIVSIQEGYLHIYGSGLLSGVTDTFIVDLPDESIDEAIIDNLGYQYVYDHKNRLIEKKISGKGWEHIIYDKLDRPVLTQDANLRANDHWLFTKYDALGRVAYTGKMLIQNEDRESIQTLINTQTVINESATTSANYIQGWSVYYTNNALDLSSISASISELYTINYYDTYNSDLSTAFSNPGTVFGTSVTSNTKSLPTGSLVYVLDKSQWITTVNYYDDKARLIYIGTKNDYLGTTDVIKNDLDDFTGHILKVESTHIKGTNNPIVVTDDYTYDHANRLLTQIQTITGKSPELIVKNTYDDLGQLESKDVGNTTASPLQNVDYKYNIRGWLKEINDHTNLGNDLFGYKINYNDPDSNSIPLYNGNISQVEWHTGNPNNPTNYPIPYRYDYSYDALNRLSYAVDDTGAYIEDPAGYDKNGNITNLYRYARRKKAGAAEVYVMDDLIYLYNDNTNQLRAMYEKGWATSGFIDGAQNSLNTDYFYDDNGNLIQDLNKGISSITYNHLNLPKQSTFSNGNIQYIYDATGIKLEKVVTEGSSVTKTKYAGNYVYEENSSGETLQFFNHPEGYVDATIPGYEYVYQYKDQVGNIRISYSDGDGNGSIDAATEIREENNYYPFGLKHNSGLDTNLGYNNTVNGTDHKYGFNGVELNETLGLNLYEMDWRHYDPAIGRFSIIDEFSEEAVDFTPYRFGFDNPIFFSDPLGLYEEVEGGFKTDEEDEIMRLLAYINREGSDISAEGLLDFIEKDITFTNKYKDGLPLSPVLLVDGELTPHSIHRIQNEVAYYQRKTDYLYTREDYEMRNKILAGGRDPISRELLRRESIGWYQPITARNYIDYVGSEKSARMLTFASFYSMMSDLDGPKSISSKVKPRYLGVKNNKGTLAKSRNGRALSARQLSSMNSSQFKNISFRDFHKQFSHLYKGRFKGRGTYLQHMARDWHRLRKGL